jgi:hypothetical protein
MHTQKKKKEGEETPAAEDGSSKKEKKKKRKAEDDEEAPAAAVNGGGDEEEPAKKVSAASIEPTSSGLSALDREAATKWQRRMSAGSARRLPLLKADMAGATQQELRRRLRPPPALPLR